MSRVVRALGWAGIIAGSLLIYFGLVAGVTCPFCPAGVECRCTFNPEPLTPGIAVLAISAAGLFWDSRQREPREEAEADSAGNRIDALDEVGRTSLYTRLQDVPCVRPA